MPERLHLGPVMLALVLAGCGESRPVDDACAGQVRASLVGGSRHAALLAEDVTGAIAQIVLAGSEAASCSGVAVGPGQVLTAAHCTDDGVPELVRIGNEDRAVHRMMLHPDLDLVLLETSESQAWRPLATLDEPIDEGWVGTLAQVAGTGTGSTGVEHLVTEVTAIGDTWLDVSSHGAGGGCLGDSGGPLLVRGRDGTVRVAGVLSSGSVTCRGTDRFVRLDRAAGWIAEHAPADAPPARGCGSLAHEGRCYRGRAVWCDGGSLRSEECAGSVTCGWNESAAGYRCVESALDPCGGIGELGECHGDVAMRCDRGLLVTQTCTDCGEACRRSTSTGAVGCGGPLPGGR